MTRLSLNLYFISNLLFCIFWIPVGHQGNEKMDGCFTRRPLAHENGSELMNFCILHESMLEKEKKCLQIHFHLNCSKSFFFSHEF